MKKKRLFQKKELDTSFELKDLARFRINLYWQRDTLAMSARVIFFTLPTMQEIRMPKAAYDFTRLSQGLIIVTGPTGCGKSTSLAAMINLINTERSCHIVTMEDPIEFIHPHKKSFVTQRQIGRDSLSFASALKYVVRQDPNVIMLGEMRDLETISTVLTLAETGHLILTTLHTQGAPETIDRIIDPFPSSQQTQIRLQLSLTLRGIIAQRLLPKISGGCVAAREVLVNTPAIANLIRENKVAQIKNVIQTSVDDYMFTLDQDIKGLYQKKLISREVALAHITDRSLIK